MKINRSWSRNTSSGTPITSTATTFSTALKAPDSMTYMADNLKAQQGVSVAKKRAGVGAALRHVHRRIGSAMDRDAVSLPGLRALDRAAARGAEKILQERSRRQRAQYRAHRRAAAGHAVLRQDGLSRESQRRAGARPRARGVHQQPRPRPGGAHQGPPRPYARRRARARRDRKPDRERA